MPSGFSYFNFLDRSNSSRRGAWVVKIITIFYKISVLNANSVDPDQMPRTVASDLSLHCLQMSLLWDPRHKWVNMLNL